MRSAVLASSLVALALAACASREIQTTFEPPFPERNAHGDPILASFVGRIPCTREGCDKLKVWLVLYHDAATHAPATYWLGVVPGPVGGERVVSTGSWTVRRGVAGYPEAQAYVLDEHAEGHPRHFWRVNDDILLVLDPDLHPKPGNGAWGYMLSRDAAPYGPRTYHYDERAGRFSGSDTTRTP